MILTEKEMTTVKDLQTQEKACIEKYQRYSCEAKATYDKLGDSEDKKTDNFLATDCISSEKLVSSEYNTNVFCFKDSAMRKLLADIQIEEQNHAEMLYKYKTVNGMS